MEIGNVTSVKYSPVVIVPAEAPKVGSVTDPMIPPKGCSTQVDGELHKNVLGILGEMAAKNFILGQTLKDMSEDQKVMLQALAHDLDESQAVRMVLEPSMWHTLSRRVQLLLNGGMRPAGDGIAA